MAKQKEATLSSRGRNTVNDLSSALAEASLPMFTGRIFTEGKLTRAERKRIALDNLCRAKQELRHTLAEIRRGG